MEFPLFQWVAAKIGGDNVEALRWTGRGLSLAFWFGCLWLAWLLAKLAPAENVDRCWFVLLLASAPIFTGYSASFLIESFTLFFGMAYLLCYLRVRRENAWRWFVLASAAGVLAALSKPTTWAPIAGVIILISAVDVLNVLMRNAFFKEALIKVLKAGLVVAIPLAVALVWVKFGDQVKMENPIAQYLTSKELASWNFGTLAQKLSPRVWGIILVKQTLLLFGFMGMLVPLAIAAGLVKSICTNQHKMGIAILVALGGYLSAPVVFTNLHFRHDYYLYANGVFLVGAFVMSMSVLRKSLSEKWVRRFYVLTLVSAILASGVYLALKKRFYEPMEVALIEHIKTMTDPGPVIFFGFDWSANISFEVERRALMISFDSTDPRYVGMIEANKGVRWVAAAVANPSLMPFAEQTLRRLGLELPYSTEPWPGMTVLTRSRPVSDLQHPEAVELLRRIRDKLRNRQIPVRGLIYVHSFLSPTRLGEGLFEIMFRRGDDLFYIDGKHFEFIRLRGYFQD